jgi:Tfp pilus assembly protein PilF
LDAGSGPKVTNRQAADVQIALGRTLEQSNRLTDAEGIYREALKKDPRRGDAHARLAVLCDRKADFKESAKHFDAAIRLNPKDPEVYCDQGYSFYVQRRWAEAETSLRKAISLEPRHARSHNNLGLVLARQGNTEGALVEFSRAGCDPSDARSNLGLILAMEGRLPESKTAYVRALELKPTSKVALEGLHAATATISHDPLTDKKATAQMASAAPRKDDALKRTSLDSSH